MLATSLTLLGYGYILASGMSNYEASMHLEAEKKSVGVLWSGPCV